MIITDEEHAEMLAEFFTTLFGPDERVHIFPMLAGGRDKFMEKINDIDEYVGGKQVKYWGYDWEDNNSETMNIQKWVPIKVTKPFSRKASSKSTKIIPHLRALSDLGYDMFFCINPLSCQNRCQLTVQKASHILLECDAPDIPVENQFELLMKHKDVFASITFSGSKSLHALLQIDPPLWNPNRLKWQQLRYIDKNKKTPDWTEYLEISQYLIDQLAKDGLPVDRPAANDYTRLSRLPGYLNWKTGNLSEIRYLNPKALFSVDCYKSDMAWDNDFGSFCMPNDVPNDVLEADILDNDVLFKDIIPISVSGNESENGLSGLRGGGLVKRKRKVNTATTNVMHIRNPKSQKKTFLDDLKQYDNLKINGIQSRHMRLNLHPIMFRVSRLLGMTEDEMIGEWRNIVSINPCNIGFSVDKAIEDFMKGYQKGKPAR